MTTNNPKTIDGKVYPLLSLNLAITGSHKSDGSVDASVAMRLIPTRIEDGVVETSDENAIPVYLGSIIEGADEVTQIAVAKIQAALQEFIDSKGL
jgi:hypothetical protein